MSKTFVDHLIHNMKLAGIVAKASPWLVEGFGEKQMNVRYVGIKLTEEWHEIFSLRNNVLLKFVFDRNSAYLEFYLANATPFLKISATTFTENDKWETLLGEQRRKLRKDKTDYLNHKDAIGNLYVKIKPKLQ